TTAGQDEVKKRISTIVLEIPDIADPWRHMNVVEAKPDRDRQTLHLEPNRAIFTRHFYKGGVDGTVVARTAENNIRLTAGDGAVVCCNWENGGLRAHAPDGQQTADGRGGWGGFQIGGKPSVQLVPGKYAELRWLLTPTGMKVWVDGELVF